MRNKFLNSIVLLAVFSVVVTSCVKDDITTLKDQGSTFIKIMEAPSQNFFYLPFTNTITIDLFSLRKDANSAAELNTATPIKVTSVPSLIDDYNTANGETFEALPDSLYTTAIPKAGNVFDMSLAAGEFSKEFTINLNGAKWDISHKYAMAFVLTDVSGKKLSTDKDTMMAFISVKNKWDAAYEVTGTMADAGNPGLTGLFPMNYHLVTTGANTVAGFDPDYWVDYFIPIMSAGSVSGYGSFAPIFTLNDAGTITAVTNVYGQPAGNARYAQIDPTGINKWDPATGNIDVKFFMFQPTVVPLPAPRVSFDWHMEFLGAR